MRRFPISLCVPTHAVGTIDDQNDVTRLGGDKSSQPLATDPGTSQSDGNHRHQSDSDEHQEQFLKPNFPFGTRIEFQKLHRPPFDQIVFFATEQMRDYWQGNARQTRQHPGIEK